MGADGHIRIYDFDILEAILGKDKVHTSATVYIHTIFGKKIVTDYWGDNLSIQNCPVCGKCDYEHDDDGSNKYSRSGWNEHEKLIEPAIINNDWEIWT